MNYRLKNGDRVRFKEAVSAGHGYYDGWQYVWDGLFILPGAEGVVVQARTPAATRVPGEDKFFANVDVIVGAQTVRARPSHYQIQRIPTRR